MQKTHAATALAATLWLAATVGAHASPLCEQPLRASYGLNDGVVTIVSKCETVTRESAKEILTTLAYYHRLTVTNDTSGEKTIAFQGYESETPYPFPRAISLRQCEQYVMSFIIEPSIAPMKRGFAVSIYGKIARVASDVAALILPPKQTAKYSNWWKVTESTVPIPKTETQSPACK